MPAAAMADTTEIRLTRLESDVTHVRADVADLKADVRDLRKEIREGFAEMRKEVAGNGKAIVRGDLMTRIWMLLLCATILGVMARGLHWL